LGKGSQNGVNNRKGIAFFDFDGTIIRKDSMFLFLRHIHRPESYYFRMLKLLPTLVLNKIGVLSTDRTKSYFLQSFLKGISLGEFEKLCTEFTTTISGIVDPWHMEKIQWHQQQGDRVIIVTASAEDWVRPWAENYNIEVIGTRIHKTKETVVGSIDGRNCKGEEKVKRIEEQIQLTDYGTIYAYGDSKADIPMLGLANFPFMKGKPFQR